MIKVINIHKAFGSNQVLKGIDLTINKGKVVVILGRRGQVKPLFYVVLMRWKFQIKALLLLTMAV